MLINLIDIGINEFMKKPTKENEFIFILSKMAKDISIKKKHKENIKRIEKVNVNLKQKIKQELQKNSKLEKLAVTDKLTGLYNRVQLDDVLDFGVNKAIRYNTNISIIFIDIDKFKSINDTYGHQVGDQILKHFSKILQSNIRKTDIAGRWGGEEFLIICHETNIECSLNLAENLRVVIENTTFKHIKNLTASFGIAVLEEKDSVHSLIQRADRALYKAKHSGRNKVCI